MASFISFCALLSIWGLIVTADEPERFKISTKRSEDRIAIVESKHGTILTVHSPSGIGRATIERLTDSWPEKLVLRLPFKGLEHFKISSDKLKLNASVSSQDGTIRIWKDGMEDVPLDAKSPYWIKLQVLDSKGVLTKTLPLRDGAIQVELPKQLLESIPSTFQVEWIDFYRN